MKKFLLFSLFFWVIVGFVCSKFASGTPHRVHYYHSKNYSNSTLLYNDLTKQKSTDGLFEWCCDCIQFYAYKLGYTYEELNIVIFVILQPSIIVYLFLTVIMLLIKKKLTC